MGGKTNCPDCGNNQVPHFLTWYQESLNVLLAPLRRIIFYNGLSLRLGLSERGKWALVRFLKAIGVISFQKDWQACKVRRAQVLWEEAEKRGLRMIELQLFGKPFDTYAVERDGRVVLVFSGLPRPHRRDRALLDVLDDKAVFKAYMRAAGLPVAAGICTRSFREAARAFATLRKPAIVKPRAGSRGRHSTTFIYTVADLQKAFFVAKRLCAWVVVEEQLEGPVYRATVIDGVLAGVLRGDPPQVVGDGIHTIAELVTLKNQGDHPGVKDILLDDKAGQFLGRQRLALHSVCPFGQTVSLSEKIGVGYGGSSSEDIAICHEDNKRLFLRAAQALRDPILGFDFIIPDITKSYTGQRCGFIEVNTLPFINLHHDPLLGPSQNVAANVWDMMGM